MKSDGTKGVNIEMVCRAAALSYTVIIPNIQKNIYI